MNFNRVQIIQGLALPIDAYEFGSNRIELNHLSFNAGEDGSEPASPGKGKYRIIAKAQRDKGIP
jgi:hypothetical protein